MEIIYLIVSLALVVSFILVKKSEEKQNILFWIFTTIVAKLSFNVLASYILTLIHIKSTLLALSILYLLLTGVLLFIIIKNKQIQKYYIKIKDIVALVLLLLLVVWIANKQFGFPFEIKYETTDPAIHYNFANIYLKEQSTPAGDLSTAMPGSYVNTGILFTVCSNWMQEVELYKVYIFFDITLLYLMAAMFYIGIVDKIDNISKSIITTFITAIFICGYPLNSMIFGYSYLSLGILMMTAIISTAKYLKNKELKDWIILIYMFLLNFGLFFSYYFFAPIIYAAIGFYMFFDMLKNRKKKNIFSILTIKNIIYVAVVLGLPTILGFCYFILPAWISPVIKLSASRIAAEGFCYRNLFSNFLLFTPFIVYYSVYRIKNKENSFSTITNIITFIFTIVLYIMTANGKSSTYYFYKTYYLIGLLVPAITTKCIFVMIDNKLHVFAYTFIILYIAVVISSACGLDKTIADVNINLNPVRRLGSYSDLYLYNYMVANDHKPIYTKEQLKVFEYVEQQGLTKENTKVYGTHLQRLWANDIAHITETDSMLELQAPVELDVNKWLEEKDNKYYLIFDMNDKVNKESSYYSVAYEDEGVLLLKK